MVQGGDTATRFSVHVEAQGDEPGAVTDDALGEFGRLLAPYSGSASGGSGRPVWGATISIEAGDVPEAVAVATYLIAQTATRAWPARLAGRPRRQLARTLWARAASDLTSGRSRAVPGGGPSCMMRVWLRPMQDGLARVAARSAPLTWRTRIHERHGDHVPA